MNKKQAAERWEVSIKTVKKICDHMHLDIKNIPEDLIPVYVPDKYNYDAHRLYIHIMDVIVNTHLELEGIDPETLDTCIEELKKENLIVLKNGRDPESLDYHDYIISPDRERYYQWCSTKDSHSMNLLKKIGSMLIMK